MEEEQKQKQEIIIVEDNSKLACYLDTGRFSQLQRAANMLSQARMIPDHYRGSIADCALAINMAGNMGIDPLLLMQKTYVVKGKLGIEAQLAIALVNKAKVFKDVIQYKFTGTEGGDDWACEAFAFTRETGVKCSESCSVKHAKDMGWWSKSGSFWPKYTREMLKYRSAMNMIRTSFPEVLFGMDTIEEMRDAPLKDITEEVNESSFQERLDIPEAKIEVKAEIPENTTEPVKKQEEEKTETPVVITLRIGALRDELEKLDPSELPGEATDLADLIFDDKYIEAIEKTLTDGDITSAGYLRSIKNNDLETISRVYNLIIKYAAN